VASRDEIIEEAHDGQTKNLHLLKGLETNMKIRVFGKSSPLTIKVSYPDKPVIKKVVMFLSHLEQEPNQEKHLAHYVNPTVVNV
jgi:hypothetical protein